MVQSVLRCVAYSVVGSLILATGAHGQITPPIPPQTPPPGLLQTVVQAVTKVAGKAQETGPGAGLATPPKKAQHFTIMSIAGVHGHDSIWKDGDGRIVSRDDILLRGQVWNLEQTVTLGADGMPSHIVIRGVSPQGDAAETFDVVKGTASWKSPIDAGTATYDKPAFYITQGGTFGGSAEMLEALLAAPDKSLALLPGGRAHAEVVTRLSVGQGKTLKTVIAYAITGVNNAPFVEWATEDGKFFANIGSLSVLPEGYEGALTTLSKAQDDAMALQSPAIAHQFMTPEASAPVAFTHVEVYDSIGQRFLADQTVVTGNGVITAAGAADTVLVPQGIKTIDGQGMTLLPGLWDAHQHVSDDFAGPMLLALGITSGRDPGNDNALTLARAARRAKGDLLMPNIYPSVMLDGKGPNSAQVATIVQSQDQAIAAVDKAKMDGFIAIKLYGTFDPAWVKATAAEAHRLGLHVHGHLPAGMRPTDAIADGYDEITHIYFVMMQAMPQDVVDHSNGIARFQGIGKYAKDVDLNAEPMKSLIAEMGAKHIGVDPTLVVPEGLLSAVAGEVSPAYAAFAGTLPPATERNFKQGGFAVADGYTRADYQAGYAKLAALVLALHKAGVPIVAGTDGSGLELVRELELYVAAGMTPAEALETATLGPAKLVGAGDRTGSITVGKAADLVLVAGDPSHNIGDTRHTRWVMMGGVLMNADDLRTASGFSGPPK